MVEMGNAAHAVVVVEEAVAGAPFSWRKLMKYAGPGLLMSIAYVDPGNLESDLQTGAVTGYILLWLLLVTTIMGFIVQMQAAKLGVATGKNLAEVCRAEYPRPVSLILWLMAEVAIIGSDIQEVIGSAIALKLLSRGAMPLWLGALVAAVASFVLLLVERAGVRHLEALFAVMVAVMVGTFGYMYSAAHVPSSEVMRGFLIPQLPRAALPTAVALFGSLIMPHNIYLHSALVQTRNLQQSGHAIKKEALMYFKIESGLSLLAALFINLFVVAVFASGFHNTGADVPDIGLQNAGEFLGAQYGAAVALVWGLGLLAAGQSSTMTGTYTGQFVMSGFLDFKVSPWVRICITRSVALLPTMFVALTMDPDSTQLDRLNQNLNLLQSIQLPFALIPVLTFTSSARIMGHRLANRLRVAAAAWAIAAIVCLVNMAAVMQVATAWAESSSSGQLSGSAIAVLVVGVVVYLLFMLYLLACGPDSCIPRFRMRRAKHVAPGSDGSGVGGEIGVYEQLPQTAPDQPGGLAETANGDELYKHKIVLAHAPMGASVYGTEAAGGQDAPASSNSGSSSRGAVDAHSGSTGLAQPLLS